MSLCNAKDKDPITQDLRFDLFLVFYSRNSFFYYFILRNPLLGADLYIGVLVYYMMRLIYYSCYIMDVICLSRVR
jgi:hypothetical protein